MMEYGKMRYNMLTNAGHWFPGANATRVSELDLRPSLAHSPHADEIPEALMDAHRLLGGEAVKRLSQQ
jgi:uncharacterized protein